MSGDWFDEDPDYDGQGKSRGEEVEGSMRVIGCLMLIVALLLIAGLIGLVIWVA